MHHCSFWLQSGNIRSCTAEDCFTTKLIIRNCIKVFSIVTVNSTFLKSYSKAYSIAPAYSRRLRRIGEVVQLSVSSGSPSSVARHTKERRQCGCKASFIEDEKSSKSVMVGVLEVRLLLERESQRG